MNDFDANNRLTRKEYGRNVQNLVKFIMTFDDKAERTKKASTLIDLMKQLNPSIREYPEYNLKLWDELFIMSDFKLDVDSPYPIPDKEILDKRPQRMTNNAKGVKYKHYGKNIELLVEKATTLENPEEKEAATIHIGKLMKTFFSTWNKDTLADEVILKNIDHLSKGQLVLDIDKVKEQKLFESTIRERNQDNEISREGRDTREMRGAKGKRRTFHKRRKN
ncbi:MAG: DUF4290 domain-containing protein [Bacteroidetes bacterium]|nr:DUF4290 domain-containing protein [Bacteroidota bacterium]MDA1119210.1 DUF4290 domain-containing protein [Bacteroidota bacterium]